MSGWQWVWGVPQSWGNGESLRLMPFFSSITVRLNKSQLLKLLLFRLWRFHQQDTLVQKGQFWGLSWAAPHFYFSFLVENSEIVTLNICINCHLVMATSNPTPATLLKNWYFLNTKKKERNVSKNQSSLSKSSCSYYSYLSPKSP